MIPHPRHDCADADVAALMVAVRHRLRGAGEMAAVHQLATASRRDRFVPSSFLSKHRLVILGLGGSRALADMKNRSSTGCGG
jgi:hypothetical protein